MKNTEGIYSHPSGAAMLGPGFAAGEALATLKVENATVDGEHRKIEADLGPVRYLATLLGADSEAVLRMFILAIALLLDPAAVLLLFAASARR